MRPKTYTYLHLNENLDPEDYVICDYRVTTDLPIEKAADAIAAEQSTGTWTGLTTLKEDVIDKYGARVTSIEGNRIRVAFPSDDFSIEIGGVPQILSVIAGNLFGLESLKKVRLEDVRFPKSILEQFPGPKHGVDGLRSVLKRKDKPLVGTIIKPKIGLSPKEMADYVYESGLGGLTNSKDDETLTNQTFCPIEERTVAIAESLDRLEQEGIHMIHAINISTSGHKILEVADKVQSLGAKQIMVDIITCGFAAVQALAEDPSVKVPIHVHRTMHGAMTRDREHGIAMLPIAKLARMCGGDALHIGTLGVGKMSGDVGGDLDNLRACIDDSVPYKTVMPVCSGGVYPGMVGKLVERSGLTVQIQAGGAVAGHPGGIRKGAMAMSQAVDAAYAGIPADKYAETHEELKTALEKWGMK
ncbi:MAG: RuBisCO large subunit C-terminal-like domain-containing protein [Candidatus Methanomethylophilaceae archaeon]|jgi:ribulose-bisphosphate carboxylase large chain|nr:RuBisCO large subunit C-terminal-like domain-containing protein [Candidatus Methanomethylophilaceae archaeon]MDD3127865.1 RuBisCO large subunit C-terminal-like domain-containing protein [Candidatus Methanomethylophilaceae archaeon]MDD4119046.1 RuBisCO large subunit C-terminal-like domain-containing protein [Candidatus Methanomethylophilaceae archaeon]